MKKMSAIKRKKKAIELLQMATVLKSKLGQEQYPEWKITQVGTQQTTSNPRLFKYLGLDVMSFYIA